jgi:hypothetical protein
VSACIAVRTKTLIPRSVVKMQLPPVLLIVSVSLSPLRSAAVDVMITQLEYGLPGVLISP